MTVPLLLVLVGCALFVVAIVFRVQVRTDLLPPVDTSGISAARARSAQRSSLAGLLPGDPALRPLALAYARRAVHNIPLRNRYLPLLWAATVSVLAALWVQFELGLLTLATGIFGAIAATVIVNRRGLQNSRTLLDEHGDVE